VLENPWLTKAIRKLKNGVIKLALKIVPHISGSSRVVLWNLIVFFHGTIMHNMGSSVLSKMSFRKNDTCFYFLHVTFLCTKNLAAFRFFISQLKNLFAQESQFIIILGDSRGAGIMGFCCADVHDMLAGMYSMYRDA
ncbi:hypothetical protein ACJX0J_040917, partial [Zea mays]